MAHTTRVAGKLPRYGLVVEIHQSGEPFIGAGVAFNDDVGGNSVKPCWYRIDAHENSPFTRCHRSRPVPLDSPPDRSHKESANAPMRVRRFRLGVPTLPVSSFRLLRECLLTRRGTIRQTSVQATGRMPLSHAPVHSVVQRGEWDLCLRALPAERCRVAARLGLPPAS